MKGKDVSKNITIQPQFSPGFTVQFCEGSWWPRQWFYTWLETSNTSTFHAHCKWCKVPQNCKTSIKIRHIYDNNWIILVSFHSNYTKKEKKGKPLVLSLEACFCWLPWRGSEKVMQNSQPWKFKILFEAVLWGKLTMRTCPSPDHHVGKLPSETSTLLFNHFHLPCTIIMCPLLCCVCQCRTCVGCFTLSSLKRHCFSVSVSAFEKKKKKQKTKDQLNPFVHFNVFIHLVK